MTPSATLVTGAGGVLGRAVATALAARDREVVGLGRSAAPNDFPGSWLRADLRAEGALAAVPDGVRSIVHCATNPQRPGDDLRALDRVIALARERGAHVVFVGIAGIEDAASGYAYYAMKLEAERRLAVSGIAHGIVRATQFHSFLDFVFGKLLLGPVFFRPRFRLQPVDVAFAAERMAEHALAATLGRAPDVRGPQLLDEELASGWLAARRSRMVRIPAPQLGPIRALGRFRAVDGDAGGMTWGEWLAVVSSG